MNQLGATGLRALNAVAWAVIVFSTWLLFPDQLDTGIVRSSAVDELVIPDYFMRDFRYASVRGQVREMEIFAETANFFFEDEKANGSKVVAYFFNINGERTKLIGDRGLFQLGNRQLHVEGNVLSESPDGFKMTGEIADYFANDRRLVSPVRVFGTTQNGDIKIWGDRAEGNLDESILRLFGNVLTDYQAPKADIMKIRSDRAVLNRGSSMATYYDNVKIDQATTKLTCAEANLFYAAKPTTSKVEPGNKRTALRYLVAKKDVEIHESASRSSQSQQAEFFAETNSIVLTGFPSVYDGRDTITGDRLTLYRSTGVIEVSAANAAFSDTSGKRKGGATKSGHLEGEDLELVIDEGKERGR